jgi:restriction system protein
MTIPNYQSLMLPVLKLANAGEVGISNAIMDLSKQLSLSEADKSALLPSGKQTKIYSRVQWAKTYLSQAGLIAPTKRGYFNITDQGRAVLTQNPTKIDVEFLTQFPDFLAFRERSSKDEGLTESTEKALAPAVKSEQTPDDQIRSASRLINSTLGQDIIDRLRLASPAFF